MKTRKAKQTPQFIAAKESGWFIRLFELYVRNLFWRRFRSVRIHADYLPEPEERTIYYLNHSSWWDGLIPFLLNQKVFRQKARAMMEDKQMKRHRFFRKIGAFSVNLQDQRSTIRSLRYAIRSMERKNASLFIYPEGRIVPFSTGKPEFKEGLPWVISKLEGVRVVPIGIYTAHLTGDKPDLFLKVGKPVPDLDQKESVETKITLERELQQLLIGLVRDAHAENTENSPFRKL